MAPPKRQRIGLVADGYGLTPGVGRGIRALLAAGRISGVSVLAGLPRAAAEAHLLKPFFRDADIGLHLCLTEYEPQSSMPRLAPEGRLPSYRTLAVASLTGKLPLPEIRLELTRQYDRFIDLFGQPPDHIDSHHHIHVLPGIRETVVELARQRLQGRGYVRSLSEAGWAIMERGVTRGKALGLAFMSRSLEPLAAGAKLRVNRGFAGLVGGGGMVVGGPRHYPERFDRFLMGLADGGLIACQPGHCDAIDAAADPYARWREEQLDFLQGPVMPGLIDRAGLKIARLSQVLAERD